MMYLEDDVKAWADAGPSSAKIDDSIVHRDSNGVILQGGDTVFQRFRGKRRDLNLLFYSL